MRPVKEKPGPYGIDGAGALEVSRGGHKRKGERGRERESLVMLYFSLNRVQP